MAASGEEEESLFQELQVLESIYLEELQISHGERLVLSITLHPATGHDLDTQYVCFTLELSIPPQYPAEAPEIRVRNPRGLCDEQINSITSTLRSLALDGAGGPILYELIEKGKEMLTASNIPRGHCVICLYDFQEGDSLMKTDCFHHFHAHCLGRYVEHSQSQELYVPDPATLQKGKELRLVYERQLANGGIIDLEAERNRFFISIHGEPARDEILEARGTDEVPMLGTTTHVPVPRADQVMVAQRETHVSKQFVSRDQSDVQRSGFRCRPVQNDHHDSAQLRDVRARKPHSRVRMDTGRQTVEAKQAIPRDNQTWARGTSKGHSPRTRGMFRPHSRGRGDFYMHDNAL
ncbi:E3 ubiquitin-protein ligase RNF25 isoform 2-T2 [Rhinophrynus dorsalis]